MSSLRRECFDPVTAVTTEPPLDFVAGPGIRRLSLRLDLGALRSALDIVLERTSFGGPAGEAGFGAIALTRRGDGRDSDLSGRYWIASADGEEALEDLVDEAAYNTLSDVAAGTYFADIHRMLSNEVTVGRMRLLSKAVWNCNSWHRDPEPRVHIPIITNPGALFVVNNHCTHLPADGSVYFTDTRGYHTALNGGPGQRVHLVAAVLP